MRQKGPSSHPTAENNLSVLRTGMSTKPGDELNLRHFHCSRETSLHGHRDDHNHRNCTCITAASTTFKRTATAYEPPGICRCTPRRVNDLVQARIRMQLWDHDQFLTACTREELDLRNRDVEHLINGMQLGNLSGLLHWTKGNSNCAMTG